LRGLFFYYDSLFEPYEHSFFHVKLIQ